MKQTDKINEIYKTGRTLFVVASVTFFLLGLFIGFLAGATYPREEQKPEVKPRSVVQMLRNLHRNELTEWQKLTMAIAFTESRFRDEARGSAGDSGQLQIVPVFVSEVNRLYGTDYTIEDAFDLYKSLEMFNLLQDYYNPSHGIEEGIKYHNRSPYYRKTVLENLALIRRYERTREAVINYKTNPVNYQTNYKAN